MLPSISAIRSREKRQQAVVGYFEDPAFKASLWLANRYNVPMPAPPNPFDTYASKRQWEAVFEQWRHALHQDLHIADGIALTIPTIVWLGIPPWYI
jgi:hypothetical protein